MIYIKHIGLEVEEEKKDVFPFSLPVFRGGIDLDLKSDVTFFVGENGSGKSTFLEAIAVEYGFNPEGGTKNFAFSTRGSHSDLYKSLRVGKDFKNARDGFFLRAESYFNLATEIEELDKEPGGAKIIDSYGGASLHEQSHGESFMALMKNRFYGHGVYILDEPEAALSPQRQLAMMARMKQLVDMDSQFIIATHSPILLGYPGARILSFDGEGIVPIAYKDTEHYRITKDFLEYPEAYLRRLM